MKTIKIIKKAFKKKKIKLSYEEGENLYLAMFNTFHDKLGKNPAV